MRLYYIYITYVHNSTVHTYCKDTDSESMSACTPSRPKWVPLHKFILIRFRKAIMFTYLHSRKNIHEQYYVVCTLSVTFEFGVRTASNTSKTLVPGNAIAHTYVHEVGGADVVGG